MTRSAIAASLLAGLVLGGGGCSLLVGTDGFDGDAPPRVPGPPDGSPGLDASPATEGGVTPPRDAGPEAEAGSADPCATGSHLLCDDFESGIRLDDLWNGIKEESGTVGIATTRAVSGVKSLRTFLNRNDAEVPLRAYLERRIEIGTWRRIRFAMDLYIVAPSWQPTDDGGFSLFTLVYEPKAAPEIYVGYNLETDTIAHARIQAPTTAPAAPMRKFPVDQWFHFTFVWDLAGTGLVSITLDGAEIDGRTVALDPGVVPPSSGAYVSLTLGPLRYSAPGNVPTPPLEVYFDNVVVDAL